MAKDSVAMMAANRLNELEGRKQDALCASFDPRLESLQRQSAHDEYQYLSGVVDGLEEGLRRFGISLTLTIDGWQA